MIPQVVSFLFTHLSVAKVGSNDKKLEIENLVGPSL